ncbi:MAG TPA: DUF3592 domain-containing protein [Herpetosiphonaceae bacterium]
MACIVGLMLISFTLGGVFLVSQGAQRLLLTLRRRRHLLRGAGMIKRVERERPLGSPTGRRRADRHRFFPIIIFTNQEGRAIEFRSETGDSGRTSRYRTGQHIQVAYDPAGQLPPQIDSWPGLWWPPLAMAAGGLLFLGGAAMVWLAFGERLTGG